MQKTLIHSYLLQKTNFDVEGVACPITLGATNDITHFSLAYNAIADESILITGGGQVWDLISQQNKHIKQSLLCPSWGDQSTT